MANTETKHLSPFFAIFQTLCGIYEAMIRPEKGKSILILSYLTVCLFPNSSETAKSIEPKILENIAVSMQMVLG